MSNLKDLPYRDSVIGLLFLNLAAISYNLDSSHVVFYMIVGICTRMSGDGQ